MSGRPFFASWGRHHGARHGGRTERRYGQATQALTTAASGIKAKMSGMICFMVKLPVCPMTNKYTTKCKSFVTMNV